MSTNSIFTPDDIYKHRSPAARYLLFAIVTFAILSAGLFVLSIFQPSAIHLAVGAACLSICLWPYLGERKIDVFCPWTFIFLNVFIGVILRSFYLTFDLPDADTADKLWKRGHNPEFFIGASILVLVGVWCMAFGYISLRGRVRRPQVTERWMVFNVGLVSAIALAVACFATAAFVVMTGGLESEFISAKRTTITDVDMSADLEYRGFGELREFAKVAIVMHLVLLAYGKRLSSTNPAVIRFFQWTFLFIACVYPFYSDSRTGVGLFLLFSLAGHAYLAGRIQWGRLIVIGVCVVSFVHGMTLLRLETTRSTERRGSEDSVLGPVHSLVANRNYLEVGKTAHIMDAIPRTLAWQNGATIGVWILAPIPRGIWPSKPAMCIGPAIGYSIYGNRVAGIPPGIIAELYWNFGLLGVPIGCFLFGLILRWMYERLAPWDSSSSSRIVLYVMGPMTLGFNVVGTQIGHGFVPMAVDMVLAYAILALVLQHKRVREPAGALAAYHPIKTPGPVGVVRG
jgi:hypothetical protein